MTRMKKILIIATAVGMAVMPVACSHKSTGADNNNEITAMPVNGGGESFIPKATVFKMSGPYADHVAVTLDNNGELAYYPAPSDITANSVPVYLGDGWWLNRQGLGANSVFTTWTMAEYAKLSSTPSPAEIKAHIIPDARVTEFRKTSVAITDAMQNIARIKSEL